jgi:hypothetical protein
VASAKVGHVGHVGHVGPISPVGHTDFGLEYIQEM